MKIVSKILAIPLVILVVTSYSFIKGIAFLIYAMCVLAKITFKALLPTK